VGALARKPVAVLSAMMPLGSAATLRAWSEVPALPVVDARRRMIGVLRQATLMQIERDRRRRASAQAYASGAAALANAYWGVVSGLVQGTLGILSPVRRVLPEE
jgi:CBS-domain-containing membrane protein